MPISKRVIQLAKERALFRFAALAQPMLQDADNSLGQLLSTKLSGADERSAFGARQFLRQDGKAMLARFEAIFREVLERAMQTMYSDLRLSFDKVSASNLTLIDDETVNRQIEVDRLLLRMREADDENLSRLNIMIAQLHGHDEVRERENPFRPYLIAQSLHQVLREFVADPAIAKILFEQLSNGLANHLSSYFAAIREVFESNGMQARLQARPGRMIKHQRYVGGSNVLEPLPEERAVPSLHQILDLMQNVPAGTVAGADAGTVAGAGAAPGASAAGAPESANNANNANNVLQQEDLQDFVRKIFDQSRQLDLLHEAGPEGGAAARGQSADDARRATSDSLISKLSQFQQMAARECTVEEAPAQHQNQLFEIGGQVADEKTSTVERVTIDMVAMMFDFILDDEQIPVELRKQLGLLQIPFLKAAMLSPELLQQEDHPARKLLNRMGSAALGLDPASPAGQKMLGDMGGIVKKILNEFDDDVAVFSNCLAQLDESMARNLRQPDSEVSRGVDAIEQAAQVDVRLNITTNTLHDLLLPLQLDKRVFDFITQTWVLVLCHEAAGITSAADAPYHRILPELIWSVQGKRSPDERGMLIRMLPDLVKQLKKGLLMVHFPEEECHQALDPLIAMHMEVLRGAVSGLEKSAFSLEELRRHFLQLQKTLESPGESGTSEARTRAIETALVERGVTASLDMGHTELGRLDPDEDWLGRMQVGVCVERWVDNAYEPAQLAWIDQNRTLYMFKPENNTGPAVYSAGALVKALREGSLCLIESAPVFDRAMESIMLDAAATRQTRG